ncbi:MAG: hypothetical protein FWC67_02485 [Defluviitaleaceae bacterium]|nr:hypothetical protein [Defluviitaleaceae bacterium]
MQAYEFLTKPENGVIVIPEKYQDKITSNIRVIVLSLGEDTVRKSDALLEPTLDTSDWKFDREEANAR